MICLFFALFVFGSDLFIKKQIEALDDAVFPIRLEDGCVLEKHHNHGFMLNRFDKHPKLVSIICCLTFFPVFVWMLHLCFKKTGSLEKFGAACIAGGAASNLWDRIYRGYVVDYLRLPIKKIRNVIFNLADFSIFLGGAITAVCGFLAK